MLNCELATFQLCKELNVLVTKSKIIKDLQEHPNYPSLISVKDLLYDLGVKSPALSSIDIKQITTISVPAIAQATVNRLENFIGITSVTPELIQYFHPTKDKIFISTIVEFEQHFTGFILLVETNEKSFEKDYAIHHRKEKRQYLQKLTSILVIPALVLITCFLVNIQYGQQSIQAIVFTLLTLTGTLVTSLILWYEFDQYNPALQTICSIGKKTNCGAILHSNASTIFGINWSIIGFIYFTGTLINLLITDINQLQNLFIQSWLNIIGLPYIAFSLYYQIRITKQWCILYLTILIIIALQFAVALWGNFHNFNVAKNIIPFTVDTSIISFIIPYLMGSNLLPAVQKIKESKSYKIELQQLKHNPHIFKDLLVRQKSITASTEGLGITIGNSNASHKIIKICDPYCAPCAAAHPAIDMLLENSPNIQVQILFTTYGMQDDIKTSPIRHLLAIAEKNKGNLIRKALNDWYLAKKKDYEAFAAKYPLNRELKSQDQKIATMHSWCNKENIKTTPTFFVNGHQLPPTYNAADLKYFLSI